MRKFLATLTTAAALTLPLAASAQTSDVAQQIAALLVQIQALQAQIAQLKANASLSNPSAANASDQSRSCPTLTRSLSLGSEGSDVRALQNFLTDAGAFSGVVNGSFDATTEKAVQAWQAKNAVVSSGTPESTGYGVVGPRTRSSIALFCGRASSSASPLSGSVSCASVPQPTTSCVGTWTAVTTATGCTTSWQCKTSTGTPSSSATSAGNTTTSTSVTDCKTPWGATLASGQSVDAYENLAVPASASCTYQVRTCLGGVLTGSYQYASCKVAPAQ